MFGSGQFSRVSETVCQDWLVRMCFPQNDQNSCRCYTYTSLVQPELPSLSHTALLCSLTCFTCSGIIHAPCPELLLSRVQSQQTISGHPVVDLVYIFFKYGKKNTGSTTGCGAYWKKWELSCGKVKLTSPFPLTEHYCVSGNTSSTYTACLK